MMMKRTSLIMAVAASVAALAGMASVSRPAAAQEKKTLAFVVNGAAGRAWTKHLLADARVTVCVTSLLNPYQCVSITGHVVAHDPDDNAEHFAKLVRKYRGGTPAANLRPDAQQRVIFKIAVDRFGYRTEDPPDETRDLVSPSRP